MTPDGLRRLKIELQRLRSEELPKNIDDIARARDHGDLRENAEYHAAKEKRAFLEAQIGHYEGMVAGAQVIDPTSLSGDRVAFGATVTVYDPEADKEATYQIVGAFESDPKGGKISYESPLARALIGKEDGDEVVIPAAKGRSRRELEIVGVEYV